MDSSERKTEKSAIPVFNNSQSKKTYLGLIELYFGSSMFQSKRKSIHFIKHLDGNTLDIRRTKYRDNYAYILKDGKAVLIKKGKTEDSNLLVMLFEEIYDVLMEIHVKNNHASNAFLINATENKYEIPSQCYNLIPEACNVCSKQPERYTTGASQTGIISIIHHLKLSEAGFYNSILIYLDENTEYILIRPTNSNNGHDMATELFKIFMEFGPPREVYINLTASKQTETITQIMQSLCSSCKIIFENRDEERFLTNNVIAAIGTWMREAKSSSWEIGCSIVQHNLNHTVKMRLPKTNMPVTAHDLFFKNPAVFNNTSELLGRWFEPDTTDFGPDYELFMFISENELDDEDPLASDNTRKSTRKKIHYQYQNENVIAMIKHYFDSDDAAEEEKPKTNGKKKKGKRRIEGKKTS